MSGVISSHLEEAAIIRKDTQFARDLGMDQETMELIISDLSAAFDIDLPLRDIRRFKNVGQLTDHIKKTAELYL